LDNILVVHAILYSLPCSNIWDVVRQNLLDKGNNLTLDLLTAKLILVYGYSKRDCLANESKKEVKSKQMALFTKSILSSNNSGKRVKSGDKSNDKAKKPKAHSSDNKCHFCGKLGH